MPKRIQRKNLFDYPWKSNPNAVYVGRPSKWGNRFKVGEVTAWGEVLTLERSLELYKRWLLGKLNLNRTFLDPLKGKDLVCFCPLDQKCHADILLQEVLQKMKAAGD